MMNTELAIFSNIVSAASLFVSSIAAAADIELGAVIGLLGCRLRQWKFCFAVNLFPVFPFRLVRCRVESSHHMACEIHQSFCYSDWEAANSRVWKYNKRCDLDTSDCRLSTDDTISSGGGDFG
jgi:hypothetical protein